MTFQELIDRIVALGFTKGSIEKRCGFYSGKLTELYKGRQAVTAEHTGLIIKALEQIIEDITLLIDDTNDLDAFNIAQFSVYEFTFPNGKKYYGSSINPESRWKHGEGYNTQPVGKAIKEFGWENVEKRIIAENLTKQNAYLVEHTLIKANNTDMPNFGYNIY